MIGRLKLEISYSYQELSAFLQGIREVFAERYQASNHLSLHQLFPFIIDKKLINQFMNRIEKKAS